jgi:hypothetical protein
MPQPSLSLYATAVGLAVRMRVSVNAMTVSPIGFDDRFDLHTVVYTDNSDGFKRPRENVGG